MLYFYCCRAPQVEEISRDGLREAQPLWRSLPEAEAACGERIIVIDGEGLAVRRSGPEAMRGEHVPPEALLNTAPYAQPKAVAAAGGYVMRPGKTAPELLMIYRRGVWDLPKGKLDAGETLAACARREVAEEVGIAPPRLIEPLGTTVHGYREKGRYLVKTTHWFLMQTTARTFEPQGEEDIEAVEWVAWREARKRIGYRSIAHHMDEQEAAVYAAWQGGRLA